MSALLRLGRAQWLGVFLSTITVSGAVGQATPGGPMTFSGWNISYQPPQGWQLAQAQGRVQSYLAPGGMQAGMMVIAAGAYTSFQETTADLSAFLSSLGAQAYPVEQPSQSTIAGFQAQGATYATRDQYGRQILGRHLALLTPHGTGVHLLVVGTQDQMPALKQMTEQLAASVKAAPPQINQQLVAGLAGRWMLYSGNYQGGSSVSGTTSTSHEEFVSFDGRGQYQYQSNSTVMVTTPGYTAGGDGATTINDQGSYTVVGNSLVLKGQHGQFVVDIVLQGNQLQAAGKTFVRE